MIVTFTHRRPLQKVFLLLLCLYATRAYSLTQSDGSEAPITFSAKSTTYNKVFDVIIKQTGMTVWFSDEVGRLTAKDLSFKATPLREVMNKLMPKEYTWSIKDNEIFVRKKGSNNPEGVNPKTLLSQPFTPGLSSDSIPYLVDISGKVVDEKGNPIPGATIIIKGTQIGTTTDEEGNFLLKNATKRSIIIISSISFITKDLLVKDNTSLGNVTLKKYVEELDATVVLAYGKTTKRLLVGNVSKVVAKDIAMSPVNNPILAVAGRLPGIQITQASGFAGSGVDIRVQGLNSIQKGSSPFYVIDGVPYIQSLLPNLGNVLGTSGRGAGDGPTTGNPLSYINTSDIESIEILKDADATAIYGSRAANGAIIITTKRGQIGKMKVDVNVQSGFGQVAHKVKLLNTQQYISIRKEAIKNDNLTISPYDYDLNGTWDSARHTDWQKELIGKNANYTNAQLTFSGGNANAQYSIGSFYHKESTVLPADLADQKTSVRINVNGLSNDKRIGIDFSSSYLIDVNKLPKSDLTQAAMILSPNLPSLLNKDGTINWALTSDGTATINNNPFASLIPYYRNNTKNLIANSNLSYRPTNDIELKTSFGYTSLETDELLTAPLLAVRPDFRPYVKRSANYGFNSINSWIIEPQLNYTRATVIGDFNLLIGGTVQQNNSNRKIITGSGYVTDLVLDDISAATSASVTPGSAIISQYKYGAAFLRVNYNFRNKILVNLSGRRDGSSRFGPANRYHNFAALGGAWVFSDEEFIKRHFRFLSFGKIKGSFGTTGNDQIGDYSYLSLYQNNNPDIPYRGVPSLSANKLFNPYLQWEETKKISFGLDLGFINERILLSANVFRNRSSNMLLVSQLPSTAGPIGGLTANLPATIQNTGLELLLTTTNIKSKDFTWSSSLNLTMPRNKLISFKDFNNSPYSNSFVIGEPINIIKVYRYKGVNVATGIYEYMDKDNKITNSPNSDPLNYNKLINPNPTYYGGISNTFSYKKFSIDMLFQFIKQLGQNVPFVVPPGSGTYNSNSSDFDSWKKPGDIKNIQRYTTSDPDLYNAFYNKFSSDAFWTNASFLRLKNLSISYYVSSKIISKAKLQSCQVYITGQNLLTFTSYKGLDPETLSNFTLPPLRVITFGIHATL
jgi:TonB-linked SusC/RagA family outer membrane protein